MLSIDPFFLRLPSIIATVATLYLLPILAKNLFPRNNSFPFFVLFFYVFSHTQISLNMVARPYPFVILAITISLIIFFNILDAHKFSLKNTVLFGITNLLIFFIDYSGIWLILSYGIFGIIFIAVYYKKNKSKTLHITYALFSTGIFCLIWLPIFIKNLKYNLNFAHRTLETSFTEGTYFDSTIWRLPFFSGIIAKESDFLVGFFQWHAMQLAVVFVSIGLFGLILIFARQRLKGSFILVATLFPLIITFIYSIYAYVIFHGRFLLTFNYFIIFGYTFISFIIYKMLTKVETQKFGRSVVTHSDLIFKIVSYNYLASVWEPLVEKSLANAKIIQIRDSTISSTSVDIVIPLQTYQIPPIFIKI